MAKVKPFEVFRTGGLTRFVMLPRPQTRGAIVSGVVSLIVSLLAAGVLVFCLWKKWLFNIELLAFLATIALGSYARGRKMLSPGKAEVRVRDGKLFVIQRVGRADRNTLELAAIVRLEIETAHGLVARFMGQDTQLSAEYAEGQRAVIVSDYPRDWLQALAAELAPFLRAARGISPEEDQAGVGVSLEAVVDVSGIPAVARDVLQPPAKTAVIALEKDGVHTFMVKRWGFAATPNQFLVFCLGMAAVGFFPSLLILGFLTEPPAQRPAGLGWLIAIAVLVLLGIVACVLFAGYRFLRKGLLMVNGDEEGRPSLLFLVRGPMHERERHWRQDEISGVSTAFVANSRSFKLSSVDAKRVRLFLKEASGRKITLLEGEEMEMRWLATELRRLLGVANVG